MEPQKRHFLNIADLQQSVSHRFTIWKQLNPLSQIFYLERTNKFIINDYNSLYLFQKNQVVKLQLYIQKTIDILAFNQQQRILAVSTAEGNISIYWLKNNTEIIIKTVKQKGSSVSPIIYFQWLYKSKGLFDFLVVQNSVIRLFKIDDDKKLLKQAKSISTKTNACWFEPKNQILACCNYGQNGNINIYHFNNQKKSKTNYKGVPLVLQFENSNNNNKQQQGPLDFFMKKSKTNQNTFRVASTLSNRHLFTKIQIDQYYIQLVHIYDKTILLFFNSNQGKLKIYHLLQNQIIKVNLNIKLPSDSQANFNIYDNLLFVHLKYDKISFIFDIKKQSSQPVVSPLPLKWTNNDKKYQNAYDAVFIKKWIIHPCKQIKKWELQLEDVFTYNKNQTQIFEFLMRRKNSKMIILKWIRTNLSKFKVKQLSSFWKHMFDEYDVALKINNTNSQRQSRLISPTDVYANVFYTLYQDASFQKDKLSDIILQCIRQILEFKLEVPMKLQNLLIKILIQNKKYIQISLLIHSKIIEDTKQIASKIIQQCEKLTNKQFQIFEQVIIDLYYRRQLYKQLIQVFLKFSLITQAIRILRKYGSKIVLQDLVKPIRSMKNEQKKRKFKIYFKDYIREYRPAVNEDVILKMIDLPEENNVVNEIKQVIQQLPVN